MPGCIAAAATGTSGPAIGEANGPISAEVTGAADEVSSGLPASASLTLLAPYVPNHCRNGVEVSVPVPWTPCVPEDVPRLVVLVVCCCWVLPEQNEPITIPRRRVRVDYRAQQRGCKRMFGRRS